MERAATLTEVLTCELHRQRELFLRREVAEAVPGLERYEATVTFLHPGWAVADWYGGRLNDCRLFSTQTEAEAELDRRVAWDAMDRVA